MSVALTKYPVTEINGKINNTFAGFSAVELEFQREDIQIISVGSGVDAQIAITVSGDLTSVLNVAEWLYLYAVGATYTYDLQGKIVSIVYGAPNTVITISEPYIENASSGYVNYKQNWFLESKLVDADNNAILKYPKLFSDDGTASGVVNVNCSMLVDRLSNEILTKSGEVTSSRNECKVMYREVWREDDTQAFILVGATPIVDYDTVPIIITYAADNSTVESFVNEFEQPIMWQGYPFSLALLHSTANNSDEKVEVNFDELDINKENITENNFLYIFKNGIFGFLQVNMADNLTVINDNTKYLRFNFITKKIGDYKAGDYKTGDYFTGE
jgi:hypothetical protein